jgi:DNA-binding MarR family transcriptional regulator
MDEFSRALNDILVEAYYNILHFEEQAIKKNNRIQLSINEMHLIESIGKADKSGRTISEIAEDLNITMPSVTIAVNKLVKKGHVEKMKCTNDGRVVRVRLTKLGNTINTYHQFYHRNMVKQLSESFSAEERECLMRAIVKLNEFFQKSLESNEDKK